MQMDFDSSDNSSVEPTGKVRTKTFRKFQFEHLLKEGKIIPASKLAEYKKRELQRVRDFEIASEDEQIHRRTALPPPEHKLTTLPFTRERYEE
jgi:hypothetical protein